MEGKIEFSSYMKVIIYGVEGSGKSSLTKRLEKGFFTEETHTDSGNIIYFILY